MEFDKVIKERFSTRKFKNEIKIKDYVKRMLNSCG